MIFGFLLFATLQRVAVGDSTATSSAEKTVMTGEVTDLRTGRGIDAAVVSFPQWRLSAKSDSGGHFAVRGVPRGHVVARIERLGYVSQIVSVTIPPDDSTASLDVALSAQGRGRPACTAIATHIPRKDIAAAKPYVFGHPRTVQPGSLVQLYAWTTPTARDSAVAAEGTLAGQQVNMVRSSRGKFIGLGAVPIDSEFAITLSVVVTYASGARRTADAEIPLVTPPKPPKHKKAPAPANLTVAPQFGQGPTSTDSARIAAETELARTIAEQSIGTPSLWSKPFIKPRQSKITSRFGSHREFNSTIASQHMGVDFVGEDGDSVVAANRGVVALVVDLYLGGTAVYIDHGAGLVSAYFHLSRVDVVQGDTVERGQLIGAVGHSGRATGPHLHWSMRLGDITVDPLTALPLDPIPSIPGVVLCRPE